MCGIVGYFGQAQPSISLLTLMADKLQHRGPDDFGFWVDDDLGVALAHRRLSILDISPAGHQPMVSKTGRYVISYNGEIYNHNDLRIQINKINPSIWNGGSDTETLLAGFELWGVSETLKYLVGMFAFAVWDRERQVLILARDRAGEKPLYYGAYSGVTIFGSELKSLRVHPSFINDIDRNALALYLRYAYVPTPYSIYKNVKKLPAGTYIEIHRDRICPPVKYWSIERVVQDGISNQFSGSDDLAISNLNDLLGRAVKQQMVSDVPLGAFLSGGIDSSIVVALMQSQSARPIRTFTIGFDDKNFDEAKYAKSIANYLGCQHVELYIGEDTARDVIPSLPEIYDEPFADSSQIPTYLVSNLARQHVAVSLTGDGADELFGGYNRYIFSQNIWKYLGALPLPLRQMGSKALCFYSAEEWNHLLSKLNEVLPLRWRFSNPGGKLQKLSNVITADSPENLYGMLTSFWTDPSILVKESNSSLKKPLWHKKIPNQSYAGYMMYADFKNYLPDDILTKVDRAAMSVSLETRVPFLDHRVINFAAHLPMNMKIRNGRGKWIVRQLLSRYIPEALFERPKMGFSVPLDIWLRRPLREWANDFLSEEALNSHGLFYSDPIRLAWKEHLSGTRNWQYPLWNILMFQSWIKNQSIN